MKRYMFYIICLALSGKLLMGCAAQKATDSGITVTPSPCILSPDSNNRVTADATLCIPNSRFSKRSRLIITPQLLINDTVADTYRPYVLDRPIYEKKNERRRKLEGYTDPYAAEARSCRKIKDTLLLPYRKEIELPAEADNGRIIAVVSSDGCCECSSIDTVEVADITNPVTLIPVKKSLKLSWIEPEFVIRPKVVKGEGVARLQFAINLHDIDLNLGDNSTELSRMQNTLAPILKDTLATLTSLEIYGMASADGSLAFNTALARRRAESAGKWITEQLQPDAATRRIIKTGSRPEGWAPVLAAMTAAGNADSTAVKEILARYASDNDDVQERYIRRLPCWKTIRDNYLSKDRKVVYVYTYSIKSFTTDKELLEMYGKRPDAFNEEELLRVASLQTTLEAKKEVYATLLKYFPQNKVAANNLAVLWLREDNEEQARAVLETLEENSPETLNALAASYVYADDYERAIELLRDVELPEARYNLGLLKARQRKLAEAYELLRPFADLNSAISALSLNRNEEAKSILKGVEAQTPVAEYVRSLTAARLREDREFYRHIGPACHDGQLRERAKTEPDFRPYRTEEMFLKAVNR